MRAGPRLLARRGVVELALTGAVQETLPLMAVEHEHSLLRVAGHPHQHPFRATGGSGGAGGSRAIGRIRGIRVLGMSVLGIRVRGVREGDLEGAVTVPGTMPDLRGRVD